MELLEQMSHNQKSGEQVLHRNSAASGKQILFFNHKSMLTIYLCQTCLHSKCMNIRHCSAISRKCWGNPRFPVGNLIPGQWLRRFVSSWSLDMIYFYLRILNSLWKDVYAYFFHAPPWISCWIWPAPTFILHWNEYVTLSSPCSPCILNLVEYVHRLNPILSFT